MTKSQKLLLRQSEIREKLNGLLAKETRTAAEDTELRALTAEGTAIEPEIRAAMVADQAAEDDASRAAGNVPDAEARERQRLAGDARVGEFIARAVNKQGLEGREAEVAAAFGCPGMLPLALFDVERPEARAVTPGVTAVQQAAPTVPWAFERSAAAALGFMFPMVGSGQANYPVVSTAAPAGSVNKGVAALATASAFRLDTRLPKRIAGQFEIRVEDVAIFPDMERALRESLMDSMSNALDEGVFQGDGTGGALDGLLNQATDVAIAGAAETFATAISRFAALVDGQYAYGWGDIRAVIGSATFAKYASIFANADKGDISAYDTLMGKLGGLRVSNRVPDAANDGQKAIVTLNAPMVPLRIPTWMGVEIIVDPYSEAAKGIKVCTATMLVGDPHVPHGTAQLKELHPKLS